MSVLNERIMVIDELGSLLTRQQVRSFEKYPEIKQFRQSLAEMQKQTGHVQCGKPITISRDFSTFAGNICAMPYLKVQTNSRPEDRKTLLKQLTGLLMEVLGKPEKFIMTALEPEVHMMFGGTEEATAYVELKSIGLPEAKTTEISKALCSLLEKELHIPQNRIYIEFSNAERHLFGWDGKTFAG